MDIRQEVRRLVREQLGLRGAEDIGDETSKEEAGFDSLDNIELVIELENLFEIEMLDNEIEKLNTIKDIVEFLEERLKP